LKEQRKRKLIIKHDIPFDFDPVTRSYTQLYELVMKERMDSKKKKALSHETFRDHLNRLVRARVLARYSKIGRRRLVYGLDRDSYLKIKRDNLNLSPEELNLRLDKIRYGLT
jgi:hypothetical protein